MANHKSALKRIRRNGRRAIINGNRRSAIRTCIKKVMVAIEDQNVEQAEAAYKQAQPEIMRGVAKNLMHKNTAARRMSRLVAGIKALKEKA